MSLLERSPILAFLVDAARLPPVAPRLPVTFAVPALAFALLVGVLAVAAPAVLHDPDTHWHVFFGRLMIETGTIPTLDQWSWTATGRPWVVKEWLAQVTYGAAFDLAGWSGVAATAIVSVGLAFALLARETAARTGPIVALAGIVVAFALASGHVLARPHVLAWPAMLAWVIALLRAAEGARPPAFASLGWMVLWSNLHGSFLLGLALVPVFAVEAFLRAPNDARTGLALRWALHGGLGVLAALCHPAGLGVLRAAADVMALQAGGVRLGEWEPSSFARFGALEAVVLAAIGALATSGVRIPLPRLVLLLGLTHMAFAHARHAPLLGLLGLLVVAEPLAHALPATFLRPTATVLRRLRHGAVIGVLVAAAALVTLARRTDVVPAAATTPAAALAAARAAGVAGEVLNDYDFGGYLLSQGVRTRLDGRAELHGPAMIVAWERLRTLADPAALDAILADPRIGWTLLAARSPVVAWLDRSPGWKRIHADAVAVVHARMK